MTRINCDAVYFEDVLYFFHDDTRGSFNSVFVGHGVDVVGVKSVEVKDFVVLKHCLLKSNDNKIAR